MKLTKTVLLHVQFNCFKAEWHKQLQSEQICKANQDTSTVILLNAHHWFQVRKTVCSSCQFPARNRLKIIFKNATKLPTTGPKLVLLLS